jgi:hypothetical protein
LLFTSFSIPSYDPLDSAIKRPQDRKLTVSASYNFIADPEKMTVKGEPKYIDDMGVSGGATKRFFCGKCGS